MNYYPTSGYMFYDNDTVDFSARGRHIDDLLAQRAVRIVHDHAAKTAAAAKKPLFLYLAPQSPHFPSLYEEYTRPQVMAALGDLDRLVGQVIASLKATGLYNNTVVVFSSDNGGDANFGGNNLPLRGQKETLWEGGLRVPAFVHSPLLPPTARGSVSHQLFHITDWLPTLARAGGMSAAEIRRHSFDGVDQWEALRRQGGGGGGGSGPRTEAVLNLNENAYGRLQGAIREGPYKLMVDMMRRSSEFIEPVPVGSRDFAYSLFNVVEDPRETVNLAANRSDITRRMAAKVRFLRVFLM